MEENKIQEECIDDSLDNDDESRGPSAATCSTSSSSSSPLPADNLGPIFEVHGSRSSPESGILTFRVQRADDPDNTESWEVTRSYEDFEGFHWLLSNCQKFEGIIFPPLPPSASSRFEDLLAEGPLIHRKQIERYLQLVCSHPTLGRSQTLADFLSPTYVSGRIGNNRKGILAKLTESFMGPQKIPNRDIEEFFQNERDWSTSYSARLKMVLDALLSVIHAEKKIIGQLKHLCTALSMNGPAGILVVDPVIKVNSHLHSKMASSFLNIQDLTEEGMQRGLCDFYGTWELYGQYISNEQGMLNRRTLLLLSYENANRNWDKAKAHKKDEVIITASVKGTCRSSQSNSP